MQNQYAVVKNAFFQTVLFEGNVVEVYAWLKDTGELDAPGRIVVDRLTSTTWEEGNFIREFEEKTRKKDKVMGSFTEAQIRFFVRDEMSKVIDKAREEAGLPEAFDAERMSTALVAIARQVTSTELDLHEENQHPDTEFQYEDVGGK